MYILVIDTQSFRTMPAFYKPIHITTVEVLITQLTYYTYLYTFVPTFSCMIFTRLHKLSFTVEIEQTLFLKIIYDD